MAISRKHRIGLLLAVHAVLASALVGLVLADPWPGLWYWRVFPKIFQVGVLLSQGALIAAWAALARAPAWRRIAGLVGGMAVVEGLLALGWEPLTPVLMICGGLSALGVGGLLWTARFRWVELVDFGAQVPEPRRERWRFSVRSLWLLTLAVALAVWGGKLLSQTNDRRQSAELVLNWSAHFVFLGLSAIWAALGTGRVLPRALLVLVLAVASGTFLTLCVNPNDFTVYLNLITIMVLYGTILLGSLWVVRSCGYRLVDRDASAERAPDVLAEAADRAMPAPSGLKVRTKKGQAPRGLGASPFFVRTALEQ